MPAARASTRPGLAIHNEIAATRPDLLPVLYRGFPYHRRGEEAADQPCVTPYDIPVFSVTDGQMSVFMVREIFNAAFRDLKRAFTAGGDRGDRPVPHTPPSACNSRPGWRPARRRFLNNYTVMHARSEFEDWDEPEQKRLMLRLWLDAERKQRPVVREIHIYENKDGRSGIDYQPGRARPGADYRAPDEVVRQPVAAE